MPSIRRPHQPSCLCCRRSLGRAVLPSTLLQVGAAPLRPQVQGCGLGWGRVGQHSLGLGRGGRRADPSAPAPQCVGCSRPCPQGAALAAYLPWGDPEGGQCCRLFWPRRPVGQSLPLCGRQGSSPRPPHQPVTEDGAPQCSAEAGDSPYPASWRCRELTMLVKDLR